MNNQAFIQFIHRYENQVITLCIMCRIDLAEAVEEAKEGSQEVVERIDEVFSRFQFSNILR